RTLALMERAYRGLPDRCPRHANEYSGHSRRRQRHIAFGANRDGHRVCTAFCQTKKGMQDSLRFIGQGHDLSHDLRKLGFSAPIIELDEPRRIFAIVREPMEQLDETGMLRATTASSLDLG